MYKNTTSLLSYIILFYLFFIKHMNHYGNVKLAHNLFLKQNPQIF